MKEELRIKEEIIRIRVTATYKAQLIQKANEMGLDLSKYVLNRLESKKISQSKSKKTIYFTKMKEPKTERIYFRVTGKEKQRIYDKAKEGGLNVTNYVRQVALNQEVIVLNGLKEFSIELNKVGVNLNQIARLCNEGYIESADICETKELLKAIYIELIKLR